MELGDWRRRGSFEISVREQVSESRNSIIQQGMSNWCLNWSLVFVTLGAYPLTVLPGMDVAMGMYPLRFHWWFAPVPFALAILIYDELRKYFIRRYPGGWMERATYY